MSACSEVQIETVRSFWEQHPVGAAAIPHDLGSAEYFHAFDALREADGCEPFHISEGIHGYSSSRGLNVLDVGCGNGYVLSRYARHGAVVSGVDLTGMAIDLSRKRFAVDNLQGTFTQVDGNTLPFADASFDIVCSMGVLHHVADPRPMVSEIYRVLKPGGRLIIMLYHRHSWKNLVLLPLRRRLDPQFKGLSHQAALNKNDGEGCPLVMVYSRGEARVLFSRFVQHKFRLTQLSWRQLLMLPPLVSLANQYLPPSSGAWPERVLGWALNVEARKPGLQG